MKVSAKNLLLLFIYFFCLFSTTLVYGSGEIEQLKELDSFKSVEKFEQYINKHTQKCLDNSYGGSDGIPCFVGYEVWDRELNKYYNKLRSILNKSDQKKLKEAQLSWIKTRDLSIKFNSTLLDKIYTEAGTMYLLMRAGDADTMVAPIIKQRALTLKTWYDTIKMPNN